MKRAQTLALVILLPILGGTFIQQPAEAGFKFKTPKVIQRLDPTDKTSVTRQVGRDIDPTARNAKYGGATRTACDAAANVVTAGNAGTACSQGARTVGEVNRQIKR